jgi:site-specific DNA recombinase
MAERCQAPTGRGQVQLGFGADESKCRRMRRVKPGDHKLAIAYVRVSTDEQRLGPEAQRSAIVAWASREGVQVSAWHEDVGVSGGSELETRAGLIAALGELRAESAGVLVVARRDRLARDVAVAIAIEKAVVRSGARIVSADGVANGESAADDFLRTILDAAAAYERALIRARTKAALAVKKSNGFRVGSIPLGYRLGADGRTLERCEREQAIARQARAFRERGLSLRAIARELTSHGLHPRSGNTWHPELVRSLLK